MKKVNSIYEKDTIFSVFPNLNPSILYRLHKCLDKKALRENLQSVAAVFGRYYETKGDVVVKKTIFFRAFAAELSEDLVASDFFLNLSEKERRAVLDYVFCSRDEEESARRTASVLRGLRRGWIDFI